MININVIPAWMSYQLVMYELSASYASLHTKADCTEHTIMIFHHIFHVLCLRQPLILGFGSVFVLSGASSYRLEHHKLS